MLVEHTAALVDHDAVAVRGGSDTLVFYAEHLTRAQRRVLRAHLLAALGDDDEPSVTIAVPSGWAAVEVSSRRRPNAPLTAGTVLFSAAAAAVLTVFVAAVIILVANEQREVTVALAPDSPPVATEWARPPGQVIGPGPQGPEQPSEQVATAAGEGVPADAPSRLAPAGRLHGDLARSGTAPSVLPDLEAASEHSRAVEPPDLPALPGAPDVGAPDVGAPDVAEPDVAVPDVAVPDVAVPDAPDLEVEAPDVEERGSSPGRIEVVDRDEDEAAEQDGTEDAGDDHDSGDAPDGGSGDEEQADDGGAVGRVATGVDHAD